MLQLICITPRLPCRTEHPTHTEQAGRRVGLIVIGRHSDERYLIVSVAVCHLFRQDVIVFCILTLRRCPIFSKQQHHN